MLPHCNNCRNCVVHLIFSGFKNKQTNQSINTEKRQKTRQQTFVNPELALRENIISILPNHKKFYKLTAIQTT